MKAPLPPAALAAVLVVAGRASLDGHGDAFSLAQAVTTVALALWLMGQGLFRMVGLDGARHAVLAGALPTGAANTNPDIVPAGNVAG
mgnify:CR=1 FL=1